MLTVRSACTATDDEIGWQGYLVPRLVERSAPAWGVMCGPVLAAWRPRLVVAG
ncbi:MAG: hypothetical protein U0556_10575 [Dehalococcoidia bacterium]